MDFAILTAPINANEVEWRIQFGGKSASANTRVVPYISNRAVIRRFNAAFTPTGWSSTTRFIETSIVDYNGVVKSVNGAICTLSVLVDGVWVSREDGAQLTDIEPLKGGISDAMKRAAVQWGVGLELYDMPKIYMKGQHKFIDGETMTRLKNSITAFNEGKMPNSVYVI